MKRTLKRLRYITIVLAAVAIGLLIAEAVEKDASAADVLAETDRFIEEHTTASYKANRNWKKIEPETVALSYKEHLANGSSNDIISDGSSSDDNPDHSDHLDDAQTAVNELVGNSEQLEFNSYSTITQQELDSNFVELTPEQFRDAGVYWWNGWKFTWYSEQVLPGGGLEIPGRWSDGDFVRDGSGYLCAACNDLEHGSIVATPFGDAIVYDAIGDGVTGTIDIYVSW